MSVPIGVVSPFAIEYTLSTGGHFSGASATAGRLRVRKPDASTETWTCTLSGATATEVVLTHTYDAGDVDQAGTYSVVAEVEVAGTWRRAQYAVAFDVHDDFTTR